MRDHRHLSCAGHRDPETVSFFVIAKRVAVPLLLLLCHSAGGEEARYLSPARIDLTQLLAPPPAGGSVEEQQDLAAVLEVQRRRSPEDVREAKADAEVSVLRFAAVLGPGLTVARVPRTAALIQQVGREASAIVQVAKQHWQRPRPFEVSSEVRPVVEVPRNGSYPSGHAVFGNLTAIVLASMVPEKRVELFRRGWRYGENRIVAGLHFPSDTEAGRIAAAAFAAVLFQDPAFKAEFAAAKAELRAALGL